MYRSPYSLHIESLFSESSSSSSVCVFASCGMTSYTPRVIADLKQQLRGVSICQRITTIHARMLHPQSRTNLNMKHNSIVHPIKDFSCSPRTHTRLQHLNIIDVQRYDILINPMNFHRKKIPKLSYLRIF